MISTIRRRVECRLLLLVVYVGYQELKKELESVYEFRVVFDIGLLCRGKRDLIIKFCQMFNEKTDDGRNMNGMSELISEAINSIVNCKEECDIDSLFTAGGTSALLSEVSGMDDFDLILSLL